MDVAAVRFDPWRCLADMCLILLLVVVIVPPPSSFSARRFCSHLLVRDRCSRILLGRNNSRVFRGRDEVQSRHGHGRQEEEYGAHAENRETRWGAVDESNRPRQRAVFYTCARKYPISRRLFMFPKKKISWLIMAVAEEAQPLQLSFRCWRGVQ